MNRTPKRARARLALVVLASLTGAVQAAPAAARQGPSSSLERAAREPLRIDRHQDSGTVVFLSGKVESGADAAALADAPVETALAFLERHAEALGMRDAGAVLRPSPSRGTIVDELGLTHVRFEQHLNGIRVHGADVIVHFGAGGETVDAVNGEFVTGVHVSTVPALGPWRAARIARAIEPESELAADPELVVYTHRIDPDVDGERLAWLVTLVDEAAPARRLFVIDARTGAVLKTRDELCPARLRRVYDLSGATEGTGVLVRNEGWAPTADADVNAAYEYTGDAYDYFMQTFGRDSFDGAGAAIVSRVHYGTGLANAFWTGAELLFGDGMAADDIVVHEYVHALTEATANLIYEDESGALSEAYSDIFGEVVDQLNGSGTDTPGAAWLLGEDSPVGAFRDMADPPRLGQPDRVSTWRCTLSDNGGVHSNSGVMNKAAYLMAEGGTFNDVAVQGIGLDKMARAHYRALTLYLTPASTVLTHFAAVNRACFDLVDAGLLTPQEFAEANHALLAVEMNTFVLCDITCPVQQSVSSLPEAAPDETEFGLGRARIAGTAYRLRGRLSRTANGRRLVDLFYEHAGAVSRALATDAALARQASALLARLTPELESWLDGEEARPTPHLVALALAVSRRLEQLDPGSELALAVARERATLGLDGLGVRAAGEVWQALIGDARR